MSDLQLFQFQSEAIRIHDREGNPWFVAKDICAILGYKNVSRDVARHTDPEDRSTIKIERGGNLVIISEPGVYSLALKCKKDIGKKFRAWIKSEILPNFRKSKEDQNKILLEQRLAQLEKQVISISDSFARLNSEIQNARFGIEDLKIQSIEIPRSDNSEAPANCTLAKLTPRMSARNEIRKIINLYASQRGIFHALVYSEFYKKVYYRLNFNAAYRAELDNNTGLDQLEKAGLIDQALLIAREIYV
jgi:prophage antirepressor-like protein